MISKGGYGKVWLVQHKKHKEIFAMKIIDIEEKVTAAIASFQLLKSIIRTILTDSRI